MRSTIAAADILRTARREAGLTQLELAKRSGIRQSVISAYERSRRQPSVEALNRLLDAMGLRLTFAHEAEAPLLPYDASRRLVDVLSLADALPAKHSRELAFPPFAGGPDPRPS